MNNIIKDNKKEKFKIINQVLDNFLNKYNINNTLSTISKLSSLVSILYNNKTHTSLNFIGFYLVSKISNTNNILEIGPYMSDILATPVIEYGKGVCGSSWKLKKTIIQNNVKLCDNYIACDDVTKSEIVIPLFINNECVGVLDIDSTEYDAFDIEDANFYENIVKKLFDT